jgi:hypothetical protein
MAGTAAPRDRLCGRETGRVLLEALDAEQLGAQDLFIVPN